MQYSILRSKDIDEIAQQFGFENITSFSVLSGGSENTNYLVATNNQKYVLTICEQKTEKSASELAHLLEYLAENKFETSKLLRTITNKPISKWNGKPVMLKVFLEGEIIQDLPNHILQIIGSEMGRLHQIEAPEYLPRVLSYGKEYFYEVGHYAANSPFEKWLKEISNYIQPFFSEDLPKTLIHSDVFFSNIVIGSETQYVRIMDFEEAANYYRVFDIGMTIIGLCSEGETINLKKASYLLKGYQEEIELVEKERRSLQAFTVYAASAMTFWRHRNFNHINPNPKMYDHYLGLKVLAEYVKKLPTHLFLELLK